MGLITPRLLWDRALHPVVGFRSVAQADPPWGPALGRMLLLRVPVGLVAWGVGVLKLSLFTQGLRTLEGPMWSRALELIVRLNPEVRIQDLRSLAAELPSLPPTGTLLLWGLLAVPLGLLGAWLHNAAWDHGCLWLAGGLKRGRGIRRTLSAESEAMAVGVLGALASLLGDIPIAGLLLSLPLAVLALYFWILRGISLAAFHEVEAWRGILAVVLHLVLVACCACGLLGFLAFALFVPLGA
ncbi:MAG: hypothetical protein HY823_03290 [Acidobacteria bacterium]|nr:hypothetical protein [Acidobacteriota bacterium]